MIDELVKHRAIIFGALSVLVLFSAIGLTKLGITPDNRVFYGKNTEKFLDLAEFENEYGSNSNIVFVIHCDQPIDRCPELDDAVRHLTKQASLMTDVFRVESLASYPILQSTSDTVSSGSFLDFACAPSCDIDRIRSMEIDHLFGRLTNENFTTLSVIAKLNLDIDDPTAVERIYDDASKLANSVPANIEVHLVGTVPLMNAFLESTYNELSGVMTVAGLLIAVVLYLTLGSYVLAGLVLCLGTTTIIITLGLAGWTGLNLNTASATIPLILFTLVVASSMHFFMAIVRGVTDNATLSVRSAISAAHATQVRPILLTAITTVACMISLLSVSSPPVQHIGIWTSVGIVVGTLLLLFVVPIVLSSVNKLPQSRWHLLIQPMLNLHARKIERRRTISIILFGVTATTLTSISLLQIDDDFIRFFDADNKFRASSEWVSKELLGPNNIEIVLDSGFEEGIFDPNYVADLTLITQKLKERADVSNVLSLLDVLEPANEHLGDSLELTSLSTEKLSQLFLAYELSLEYGYTTRDIVSIRRNASRISLVVDDISSREIRALEEYILSMQPQVQSGELTVTGESIPISHLSPDNILSMTASIVLAFVLTALALAIYFRRWRIAVIAVAATVIPVVCGFGIWGLFFDSIGLASTVIVAVCMGVVIDDAIHMIYAHTDATKRLGLDGREASAYAVHRVGSAMLTTTVVLGIGFSVMLLSDFRLNSSFGGCSALILVCALAFDLRILPEMLVWSSEQDR